ncbi:Uncharacterized protein FWK35_00033267 [Aphis craccivora]|uniref:Uncharacterized protein n=1 Tax=Aphis craccivora TaxID=307492 RepID=A0A6G0VK19_APHCR|nr:Uncharacterized protein FWK35_00033267 [Aphis craccivora]
MSRIRKRNTIGVLVLLTQFAGPGTKLKERLARGDRGCLNPKTVAFRKKPSWLVTTAMKVKHKMRAGCGFKQMVTAAKNAIKNKTKEKNITKLIRTKLKLLESHQSLKKGGVLPLIPIFAGLSALGALTGGIGSIVKVVNDLKSDKNTPIHLGKGLYLAPYKGSAYKIVKGNGLYLAPYKGGW